MADATQVQRRRGTASQCAAMTPAEGEIIVNMTDDRLHVGDGLLAGGIILPNARDIVRQSFTYGVASGTPNAITLSVSEFLSYSEGSEIQFRATAANTGTVTVAVNALGTRNLYKNNGLGIVPLVAGDIVSGGIYRIVYDGAQFQIANFAQRPVSDTGLVKIATLTGTATNNLTFTGLSAWNGFKLRYRFSRSSQGVQTLVRLFLENNAAFTLATVNSGIQYAGSGFVDIERGYVAGASSSSTFITPSYNPATPDGGGILNNTFSEISIRASSGTLTTVEATLYGYAE